MGTNTINLKQPATPGMCAYAAWHGMTIAHVQDVWAEVPQDDRIRAKWESVGTAVEAPSHESRRMFVERLRNLQHNGKNVITIAHVLSMMDDCDMLAEREPV
jgi:hypothetical protein